MKTILLSLLILCSFPAFAQDIITFTDGNSIKAKVIEMSDTEVKYYLVDDLEGPLYVKSTSKLYSITFKNGRIEKFNIPQSDTPQNEQPSVALNPNMTSQILAVNNTIPVNSELNTSLRRLKGWSKFFRIYGWLNVGSAILLKVVAENYEYDPLNDETDYTKELKQLSTIGFIEGGVSLIAGFTLLGQRNRLMRENNLVGSVPIIQKEFQFKNCSIAPSVNLMSFRNNPADGIGAGFTITH